MKSIKVDFVDDQRAVFDLKDRYGREIGFQAIVRRGRVVESDRKPPVSLEDYSIGDRVYYVECGQYRGGFPFGSNQKTSPALPTQAKARQWALEQAFEDRDRTEERLNRKPKQPTNPHLGAASKTLDQKFEEFISSF